MIWPIFTFVLLSMILWLAFLPISMNNLNSHIEPVANFEDAIARVKTMQDEDNQDSARDVCITKLYDHGRQTEHVVVLLHGFTNCPEQFNELGTQYYESDYNV